MSTREQPEAQVRLVETVLHLVNNDKQGLTPEQVFDALDEARLRYAAQFRDASKHDDNGGDAG